MGMKVADKFRTNERSLVPGGNIVSITYANKKVYDYDKIKNVDAYIKKAKKNASVVKISVGGNVVWEKKTNT